MDHFTMGAFFSIYTGLIVQVGLRLCIGAACLTQITHYKCIND
jgi:hypothetical protein